MRNRRFVVLLVGVALAVALWGLWPDDAAVPSTPGQGPAVLDASAQPASARTGPEADRPTATAANERVAAAVTQGLRGRTVAGAGAARPLVVVAVVPIPELSPFALAQRAERGLLPQAVATMRSDAEGRFELAVPAEATAVPLEVWALGTNDADAVRRVAGLSRGEWRDVGELVLAPAFPVHGIVVDSATEAPIAGAWVSARPGAALVRGLPGRDQGLRVVTGADGRFQFDNLGQGVVSFTVGADGFAWVERPQQHVFADQPNELLFALAPGGPAAGFVVDELGNPVAAAFVRAEAADPANAARPDGRSDAGGRFRLEGLDAGAWFLRAAAPGYQAVRAGPVTAGTSDVRLELRLQAGVRVQVVAGDGRVLDRYTLVARPPLTARGAALRSLPALAVRPEDVHDGRFTLGGLDDGAWQLEVQAPGHALTFSAPFDVRRGTVGDVSVALAVGGSLRGRVQDDGGAPRPGVVVRTQPDGFLDGGAGDTFRGLLVWRTSEAAVTTDRSGQFVLEHLAAGDYQLRLDAPGSAPRFVRGLAVRDGQRTDLPTVAWARGTAVTGSVSLASEPAAGVFVQVVAIDVAELPAGYALEQPTDAQGRFELPVRVPAGRYVVMAGRRLPDNKFQEDADRAASRQEITVAAGEERRQLALRLVP